MTALEDKEYLAENYGDILSPVHSQSEDDMETKPQKRWLGPVPTHCDICNQPITTAFIDGKTQGGPWGNMCPKCHGSIGVGLGQGRGQKYEKQGEHWPKTEG